MNWHTDFSNEKFETVFQNNVLQIDEVRGHLRVVYKKFDGTVLYETDTFNLTTDGNGNVVRGQISTNAGLQNFCVSESGRIYITVKERDNNDSPIRLITLMSTYSQDLIPDEQFGFRPILIKNELIVSSDG